MGSKSLILISSMISVWSFPLEFFDDKSKILLSSIQFFASEAAKENEEYNSLYNKISTQCKWEEHKNEEDIISEGVQILKILTKEDDALLFELGKSFQLFCQLKGWTWTYNYLICKKLSCLMVPSSS